MTRATPALLLVLALLAPARAQDPAPSCLTKEQLTEARKCQVDPAEFCSKKPADPAGALTARCKALPGAQVKEPSKAPARLAEEAAKRFAALSGKVAATLGRGEVAELYGEGSGRSGGVAAMRALPSAARPPPPAAPAPGSAAGPYDALYSGLDGRSAAFWTEATAEFAGNPKGKELLDRFAAQGAPLPKLVVEKIDTASYDMVYQYGRNEMVVGTRFLAEYGLKPADLDVPAKRAAFINAASPLLYHETDHAWADARFPRKTAGVSASFGREINAYADEMAFIHHKAKKDSAWAESRLARGFMAQYDAYLEDPGAFMDKTAKSPGYKDMPSMETMRRKVAEELELEKKRPKRKFPGLEDDYKSIQAELDYEEKTVVPALNAELALMRTERAIDGAASVPSPQALDKLTLARKRVSAFPAEARAGWRKKIEEAGAKAAVSEAAAVKDALQNGNAGYGDQSLRALEDWSQAAGGNLPADVAARREEVYRGGIKNNLAYAEANVERYKKSKGEMKARHKQALIYTLNEAREDAARLGVNIDADLLAVIKKAGL